MAADEVLRYEPISFGTARLAAEETEVAGVRIPAGSPLSLNLVAACRDPRRYDHPDTFDVTRDEARSPAFGAGIHYCLGAALARAELEEAMGVLADHVTSLHLESEPRWVPFASIRHFAAASLWLTLEPR